MVKDDAGQTDFYFRWKKSRLFYIFFGCTILHPEDRERERKREKESIVSRHRHAAPTQQSLAHWQRSICGWHHHLPYASFQQKPKTKDSLNLFKADVVVCVCVYMLFFLLLLLLLRLLDISLAVFFFFGSLQVSLPMHMDMCSFFREQTRKGDLQQQHTLSVRLQPFCAVCVCVCG